MGLSAGFVTECFAFASVITDHLSFLVFSCELTLLVFSSPSAPRYISWSIGNFAIHFDFFSLDNTTFFHSEHYFVRVWSCLVLQCTYSSPLLDRSTDLFSFFFTPQDSLKRAYPAVCGLQQTQQGWISMRYWSRLGKEHSALLCW